MKPISHTIDGEPLFEEKPPKSWRFPELPEGMRLAYVGKGPKNEGRHRHFAVVDARDGRLQHAWIIMKGNSMIQWKEGWTRFIVAVPVNPNPTAR